MSTDRLELHRLLLGVMRTAYDQERQSKSVPDFSSNVYFQPPSSVLMKYPAIVYERNQITTRFADDSPYLHHRRYTVTVIDDDPDSPIVDLVANLPRCQHSRHFYVDNLNHDAFDIFY